MRWKSLAFLGKLEGNSTLTYGFTSKRCPPVIEQLSSFEHDMMLMIKNLEFKIVTNDFQQKLNSDIEKIRKSSSLLVHADKSRNIYKLKSDEYNKLLKENITKTYRKCDTNKVEIINRETKKIV